MDIGQRGPLHGPQSDMLHDEHPWRASGYACTQRHVLGGRPRSGHGSYTSSRGILVDADQRWMTRKAGASRGVRGTLLAAGAQGDEGTSKDTGKS